MKINDTIKLIIAIGISEAAGIIGAIFTAPSIPAWYAELAKPAFNPPAWIFAPVWTTLYFLMGIAVFFVYKSGPKRKEVKIAIGIFIGQLALNTLWSVIFFGFRDLGLAFLEIIFLWLAIAWTIIVFYRIFKLAAYLLIPYILWVSFAAYLNYAILILN